MLRQHLFTGVTLSLLAAHERALLRVTLTLRMEIPCVEITTDCRVPPNPTVIDPEKAPPVSWQ
jgi:hypothetical protein